MADALSLTAYDLWKSYGDEAVVQGISFTLAPGEIVGLLGPNGAGKTTTVGMLFGTVIPTRGFVRFGPWQLPGQGQLARAQMGIVTQEDNLDPDFTVFNNLTHFAHHYRITGALARQRAGELLALVNLEHRADAQVDELSGGMKRRLVLARALLNNPKIVFLDEPTTGLDPDARQDFWRLVQQLKASGCGILLTTHYMDEAQRLCDRLLLLQRGKVIDEGSPSDLVARVIGREIAEVEGVAPDPLRDLAARQGAWYRAFGSGYLVSLPDADPDAMWQQIQAHRPTRLRRRPANLEDVFLRLTGSVLE
ncbi:ABC transporter ATP-binding protein [Nodosilinea nodulosa]|uniref:ABC transporter ATP-binding protein n=1 Tax=Nodosilinea nodulosa TaxID=416001 RepID=UPI0003066427|nr:ATP-binding cassette domain-containing protein [Nodosilinea nodulosa]